MEPMAQEQETYNITFTAGAAMLNEMHAVAEALRQRLLGYIAPNKNVMLH